MIAHNHSEAFLQLTEIQVISLTKIRFQILTISPSLQLHTSAPLSSTYSSKQLQVGYSWTLEKAVFVATNSWITLQLPCSIVQFKAASRSVMYLGSVIIWVTVTRSDLNHYISNLHKFVFTAYSAVLIAISFLGYFTIKMVTMNVHKAKKPTDIQTLTPLPSKNSPYITKNCMWLVVSQVHCQKNVH